MKLAMAGIDFKHASLDVREKISFGKDDIIRITKNLCKSDNVDGCVILSTCNRTEIYMSFRYEYENPAKKLFDLWCGEYHEFKNRITVLYDADAALHLSEVACGIHSAIICEEQIVTQINEAADLSRSVGGMDAVLNSLFRGAVSSGKKALTDFHVSAVPSSSAVYAVDMAEKLLGGLDGKKALVIGSGKVGCLAAKTFVQRGCETYMTLRSYTSGINLIPCGVKTVPYSDRMSAAADSDIILSATRSPHYTMTAEDIKNLNKKPECIFDLAVPRDIEPGAEKIVRCFNIDDMFTDSGASDAELEGIRAVAEEYADEFLVWDRFRNAIPSIENIKRLVGERVLYSPQLSDYRDKDSFKEMVSTAAEKAADLVFKSIKEYISRDMLDNCRERLERNGGKGFDNAERHSIT